MNIVQLQELYQNRLEGESINDTLLRRGESPSVESDISYDRELTIPRYKIIQPSCTLQDATIGCFRNMFTGEEVEKLENIVFLVQQNSRTLFPSNDFSGVKQCFSFNGYTPSPDVKERTGNEPISNQCAMRENGKLRYICPHSEWRNELGEIDPKGTCPPRCKPTISFLGIDQNLMPFWTTFHSTGLAEAKKFLQFVRYKKEELKRKGETLELYSFSLTISLELITNTRGKYYVPKFANKEIITSPQKKGLLQRCFFEFKDRLLTNPIDTEET